MLIALALLVSADPITIQHFSHALRELSISPDVCQEAPASIRLLNCRKFDAFIVDLQLGEQSGPILDEVRLSPSNRSAVTFAISGSGVEATATFRKRTGFVFERPLSTQSIRSTLKPAYGPIPATNCTMSTISGILGNSGWSQECSSGLPAVSALLGAPRLFLDHRPVGSAQ